MKELTKKEFDFYDRQIRIPNFGVGGQKRLKSSKVVVAGLGGLGCAAATYLVAAGIGYVILIDRDVVELSNLNRQTVYEASDVGKYKAVVAEERLSRLNPGVKIRGVVSNINEDNACDLIKGVDVVVDGQDNFETRFVLNRACMASKIPFVHAAVHNLEGRLMTIIPGKGPCLRCLIPVNPPQTEPSVLGSVPALMACAQATETVKLIVGMGKPCIGRMIIFDGEEMKFDEVVVERRPDCPVCGKR